MYGQDLLGPEDIIGGRPYVEYLGVLTGLAGRAQKHLCLSAILKRRHPNLHLQNLLTTFSPFDEFLVGLTRHLDGDTLDVQRLLSHLVLAPDNKYMHLSNAETAWAPLIRASNNSLILPVYGIDINPFLFLLNDLRQKYPDDWFKAANRREMRWIAELMQLFPSPRWKTGSNAKLKRNGQVITDLDFWAFDVRDGSVALFQLKWQQPVGIDNRARRSTGRNLMDGGNKWIDAVLSWLDENGLQELATRLGLDGRKVSQAKLFVLARYNAWFPGFSHHAETACWSDWNHIMQVRFEHPASSVSEMHEQLLSGIADARAALQDESYIVPIQNIVLGLNATSVPPTQS